MERVDKPKWKKILEERVDKQKWKKILEESVKFMINYGVLVIIVGIIYLGAMAGYFHVDNLINTSSVSYEGENLTIGQVVGKGVDKMVSVLSSKGYENPFFWFWSWWIIVFAVLIYPTLKIMFYTIKYWRDKNV